MKYCPFSVAIDTLDNFRSVENGFLTTILAVTPKAVVFAGVDDVPVVVALNAQQLLMLRVGQEVKFSSAGDMVSVGAAGKAALPNSPRQSPCAQMRDC